MGCINPGKQSSTVEPQKAPNANIPKQNKILAHSNTKKKIAQKILEGLEDKNVQVDEQLEMEKQMDHKKNQEQKTYDQKRDLLYKQILKTKYPPNSKIQTELKHQLPSFSNLQSKVYLRDVKEELIFVESNRVGIIQQDGKIYDGYCNKQQYDGFGMIIEGTTHKIGSFFEKKEMYGQGLYTNHIIFQLGLFRDFRLQGYGVYYKYVEEKKQKIYKGKFLQDVLDAGFPNYIIKYIKLQKYFGFTFENRIDNFGFIIEKNQISQFVYHRNHKQFKISTLKNVYQNLTYIELFKVWSKRVQNLIQFILNIRNLQEENKFILQLEKLKDELNEFWKNYQDAKFKKKKFLILAVMNDITMKQFIKKGGFILIHHDLKIFIKVESQIITECIISESLQFKHELDFKLQEYTIRLKQDNYLYFGSYNENDENGKFQQYKLFNPQIDLKDILEGEKQLTLPICEKFDYYNGKPIRDDKSSHEFDICSDEDIVYYFQKHSKYSEIDEQFKKMIDKVIKVVSSFKTYSQDGIYYKGQWEDGKFNGIGIKYNEKLNQYNLGIFEKNLQTQYGLYIDTQYYKLIIELSEFKDDKKQDICKIQELSDNEQLVLYVKKEEGVKQKDGIMIAENKKFIIHYKDDIHFYQEQGQIYIPCEFYQYKNKSLFSEKYEGDKQYKEFIKKLSEEEQILLISQQYDNYSIYDLFGQQMQGKFIQEFDNQEFGRSIKKEPFEMYEGMFQRGKRKGFGKLLIFNDTFQLHIGIFDEVNNQQQIFVKIIEEDLSKISAPQKIQNQLKLKYEITNQYLYNIPEINSKEIVKEQFKKIFDFTKLMEFVLKPENEQRISKFKPILRTADNDLVFLKTQIMDKVIKLKINSNQSQYQGEMELNSEVTGYVVINNEQEDSFSFGYIYQNKLINTYLHLTTSRILKEQEDLIYKSISAKTSLIQKIVEDGVFFTLKKRKYPHKFKYLMKLQDNQNEFGATFHENGLYQYFQQINKTKVYPSNGQVNYNFKKINLKEQQDPYEILVANDEFQLSLYNWITEINDSTTPMIPVIIKPINQYYTNKSKRNTSRRFWHQCKKLSCERFNSIILIRMVNQVDIYDQQIYYSIFEISLNKKKQLRYRFRCDENNYDEQSLRVYPLYSRYLKGFDLMKQEQFDNFLEQLAKDSRLQKYFYKVLKVKEDLEKMIENEKQKKKEELEMKLKEEAEKMKEDKKQKNIEEQEKMKNEEEDKKEDIKNMKKEEENYKKEIEKINKVIQELEFDVTKMSKQIIEAKQIKFDDNQKAYIHISKEEQRALIINEDYLYYGQYDEVSPNGYGFAYYLKENYKYKGQWLKGQKEGWGYVTYFYDREIRNKLAKEKQFDRFNQDIAENLPDLTIFQQVKFPLIELSAQQIEFIKNCKQIYFSKVEQLNIGNDKFKLMRSIDQLLGLRNLKDENSFMIDFENNCFKEFKLVAFKNRLAGSIYLGSWSKQNMHGYGKIVYQSDNFYSGYFKNGQRDFRGLYLKNIKKRIDESFYLGFWKEDKQDSNYYLEKDLNKQSLLANAKEIYIGDFKQDQQDGSAKIYDYKALIGSIEEQQPISEIQQVFKIQVDSKNFQIKMIYMGDSDQQLQPVPQPSDEVVKLMEDRFKLKIQRKQNIQKDVHQILKQEVVYCPLYFKVQLFNQEFYYKGQWKDYQPSGEGYALNQNTYIQGIFKDGQMTDGYYICENYQYFGNFKDQQMEGKGEYYNNTIYYKGQFAQGVFHGDGNLKFHDSSIQQIQSGKWEYGRQKVDELVPQGTAIKYTLKPDEKFIEIAKRYNYVLENEIKGHKYVQSENFFFGNIHGFQKGGQGLLLTRDNILYYGKFIQDKFAEGLIIKDDIVQIISYNEQLNNSKMLEDKKDDYQFYGNCKFMEHIGIYEKTDGCLIKDDEKFVGQFNNGKKKEGKLIYDYGCIIELIYDENEKVSKIVKIQYQINTFMRNIMNKFNLYQINVIDNPQYSQIKFDEIEYFSIEDPYGNQRILINQDKIIYQYISDKQAYYMREYDLKNNTFYLGGVKNERKSTDQAIYYDQSLDELYFGGYEEGKREGNGRFIKQNQIKVGTFKEDEFKSGKIYNQDGSYFKTTLDKNKDIKPMIYHLGILEERWSQIDEKLEELKKKLEKYEKLDGYFKYREQQKQVSALKILNEMAEKWSECKESIKIMNSEGCKLIVEQSIVVPINEQITCLVVLEDFSITHDLIKVDDSYFGCCYKNKQLVLGYFNSNYNVIKEELIFYEDGSIQFQKLSEEDSNIEFIRYFQHEPNEELKNFQKQLEIFKNKQVNEQQKIQFQQAQEKIIDQLQDVVETNRNFFRLLYSSLMYRGCMNSDNDANGKGEAYREGYYFIGYRQNGTRKYGDVYEEKNYLYQGELDGSYDGLGIQIGLDYQYIGYFSNDQWNGKGKKIKNGIIIEAVFESDNIKSDISVKFDNEKFRPKILYEKIRGFINQNVKLDQFNKEIKLLKNNIHRIDQNKGDIIFENGDYQWGTFDLGILQDGLYYNKKEDKIYIGKFQLGYLNGDQGFTFDGKILIEGKFLYGIMNGPLIITWFGEKMEKLSILEAEFENGNPIKIEEKKIKFRPKKWQEVLMEKKGLQQPYEIDVNGRFLVFQLQDQDPYTQIYIDVFQNELLYKNDGDRVLIHYEDGKVQDLEILNFDSFFYQIVMNEKTGSEKKNNKIGIDQIIGEEQNSNLLKYSGPGFFNMKHYENKNQGHKYKYDKLWYEEQSYNQTTGVYEIQQKYVFGKLVHQNLGDQQQKVDNGDKQNKQQEQEYNKYQQVSDDIQLNEYETKLQTYLTSLGETLNEEIKIQEEKEKKRQEQNKKLEINQNLQQENTIQQQIEEQKNLYKNIPLLSKQDDNDQIQQEPQQINEQIQGEQEQ